MTRTAVISVLKREFERKGAEKMGCEGSKMKRKGILLVILLRKKLFLLT